MLFFSKIVASAFRLVALVPDGLFGVFKMIILYLEVIFFATLSISSGITCQLFSIFVWT